MERNQWPVFVPTDSEAVEESVSANFKLAIGGAARMRLKGEQESMETIDRLPPQSEGWEDAAVSRRSTRRSIYSIVTDHKDSSTSVLIPGQGPLKHRAAIGERFFNLLDWFVAVEAFAWKKVRAYFLGQIPSKIFIVTGQILTKEYFISHKHYGMTACEVELESDSDLPTAIDTAEIKGIEGQGVKTVVPVSGFEQVRRSSPTDIREYSIILKVRESAPTQWFRASAKTKVLSLYRL